MIWIRGGLLALAIGVLVLALSQTTSQPAQPPLAAREPPMLAPAAAPPPTRVPLPTALPQMIISRIARETPPPRATVTPPAQPQVHVVDNGYFPAQLSVGVGSSVTWINRGGDAHDIIGTGPGGAWHSWTLSPADRYERPFALPGTYDFACSIHPEMRGRIVVVVQP
jgi:plastocyanin